MDMGSSGPRSKLRNPSVLRTYPKMEFHDANNIPDRSPPGLTRTASGVGCAGHLGGKSVTAHTKQKWSQEDNKLVMLCYYKSEPEKRGYRKRMVNIWKEIKPTSEITEQRLADQRRAITKKKWLTDVEFEELRRKC